MTTPEPMSEPDLPDLLAEIQRLSAEAGELARNPGPGTDLVVPTTSTSPEAIKAAVAAQRSTLVRKSQELRDKREQLRTHLQAHMHMITQALDPLRAEIKRLEEMVWTVNLYLGRDEEIVTLLDADPAPAETPIVVRQLVLSMDEETILAAETGGIDFRDLDAFDEWITNPVHLHQVLPEPRGVVVLVPRRSGRDYGDMGLNALADKENHRSYWLIRNGGRLFRMSTDFSVGTRLTPTREEFHSFFTTTRYNPTLGHDEQIPLEPGSHAWLQAEKAADERRRHYMRAALILQGLIDRTTVFHPLPHPQVSLLQPDSYDAGHVQLICDAENTLGTGRRPFYEWLAERNAQLRPGMRIVGAFNSEDFRAMRSRENSSNGEHDRIYPARAENPPSRQILPIASRRDDGGLVIRYDRTEEVYTRGYLGTTEYRKPKVRASCTLYPRDRFILPLDLVTEAEIRDYLGSRTERHAYRHMMPLLTTALAVKHDEAEAEAPFRDLLTSEIARTHGVDLDEAAAAVPELVSWWKYTTVHHRPLVLDQTPQVQAAAITQITAEFAARRTAAQRADRDRDTDAHITARLREHVPDAMLIARARNGNYIVLAPQARQHPEILASRNTYVREYSTGRTARTLTERHWVLPSRARLARWTILWTGPQWQHWDLDARPATHLTDPEIDTLLDQLITHSRHHRTVLYQDPHQRTEPTGTPVAVACRTEGTGRVALRVYLDPGNDLTVPDRLLTGTHPTLTMRMLRLRWRRGTGGTVEHEINERAYDHRWEIGRAWKDEPDIQPPWHNDTLAWTDDPRIQQLYAQAHTLRAAQEQAKSLAETCRTHLTAVAAAWKTRAEHAAHARFLEDYADPSLWEGHRKTLTLNYPHHQHRGLRRLIARLVEDGHDLTGHTVATAAELLGEDIDLPDDITDLPLNKEE